MAETVGDYVLRRLREWGVRQVFGYPGDGINGLVASWDAALSAEVPTVLDVRCDPEVPPIPPHATFEQIKSVAEAVLKRDPEAWHLVVQGAKTKLRELLP